MQNIRIFIWKLSVFVKFSIYLNRSVFVMRNQNGSLCKQCRFICDVNLRLILIYTVLFCFRIAYESAMFAWSHIMDPHRLHVSETESLPFCFYFVFPTSLFTTEDVPVQWLSGRASALWPGVAGSIPGRFIPKTLKNVTSCFFAWRSALSK